MDKVEYCHLKNYTMPVFDAPAAANNYGSYTGSAANHHLVIQNVIDVLHNRTSVATSAAEGMKVVDMIERIYKAGNINGGIT